MKQTIAIVVFLTIAAAAVVTDSKFIFTPRCRIVPAGTTNCTGNTGVNCRNTAYLTVS